MTTTTTVSRRAALGLGLAALATLATPALVRAAYERLRLQPAA